MDKNTITIRLNRKAGFTEVFVIYNGEKYILTKTYSIEESNQKNKEAENALKNQKIEEYTQQQITNGYNTHLIIKELRTKQKKTQAEIANQLMIPLKKYREYEQGKKDIPLYLAIEIAKLFNTNLNFILTKNQ